MKIKILSALTFIIVILISSESMASNIKYTITEREDGGYTIIINTSKRLLKMITAEGFFPKIEKGYKIELIGNGQDWKHRGYEGYFYSIEKMKSKQIKLDVGYAWVDKERKYLYLNIYFAELPDKIISSEINGMYRLECEGKGGQVVP